MMKTPRKTTSPELAVRYAVSRLKDAEIDLLVAIRTGKHRRQSRLLAVLVLVREARTLLSGTAAGNKSREKTKRAHLPTGPGARFV
jgi:hypothetical protein